MFIDDRTKWTDTDWAAYLGCSVNIVPEYRRKLETRFFTRIAFDKKTEKYHFEMYGYEYDSFERRKMVLLRRGNDSFDSYSAAAKDANVNIIQKLELNPAFVKMFGMPSKAMQLLVVKHR